MDIKKADIFNYPMIFIIGAHGVGKGTVIKELLNNKKYQHLNLQLCPRFTNKDTKKSKPEISILTKEEFNKQLNNENMIVLKRKNNGEISGIKVSDLAHIISNGKIPILEVGSGIEDFLKENNLLDNYQIKIILIAAESCTQILDQIKARGRNTEEEVYKKELVNKKTSELFKKYAHVTVINHNNQQDACSSAIADIIASHVQDIQVLTPEVDENNNLLETEELTKQIIIEEVFQQQDFCMLESKETEAECAMPLPG